MNHLFNIEISDNRIHFLFEEIYALYHIDFRNYNINHLKRRVSHHIQLKCFDSLDEFYGKVLSSQGEFSDFMRSMSIQVTDMFRDTSFFRSLKNKILPKLNNLDNIKVWVAGCSTGEEVYTLAILLSQLNIIDKSRIIATDFSISALEIASRGKYSKDKFRKFEENYQNFDGNADLKSYFSFRKDQVKIDPELSKKIVFAQHNLVSDSYFNNLDLILCRNVLIYFNAELQSKTIDMFYNSLNNKAFLGLGNQETIYMSIYGHKYKLQDEDCSVYQKLH